MQSYVNKIDFDYKEYASQRFRQYWLKKPIVMDSTTHPAASYPYVELWVNGMKGLLVFFRLYIIVFFFVNLSLAYVFMNNSRTL